MKKKRKNRPLATPEQIKIMHNLAAIGVTDKEIAEAVNLNSFTVAKYTTNYWNMKMEETHKKHKRSFQN